MPFHFALKSTVLKIGEKKCVTVAGKKLVLVCLDDGYYALDSTCPHRGGQLCDGKLDKKKGEVICGLHNWNFDLRTGVSPYNPADKVQTYVVEERKAGIYIDIPAAEEQPDLTDYLDPWRRRADETETEMEMIHHMADGWIGPHGQTDPMRTERQPPLWDQLVFLPRQVAEFPQPDAALVNLKTVIGSSAKKPLQLDLPVYVSHMSFGALSREAKIALAKGSAAAGTMICSGEGGLLPDEQEAAATYVFELASGGFGWTEANIAKADAIEIKMGQAAKAGLGGVLPGTKVTEEIAKVRGLKVGQDALSPSAFPDFKTLKDLKKRVAEIKKMTGGKPVGIKFAASRVEEDLAAALECQPDFITIDGRGGATAAAPKHVKDNICVPTLYALDRARRYLEQHNVKIELLVTGGLRLPADFAKAIALGATAVATASAALMAIGCQQYRACHTGKCPVGIATQDLYYRGRLDIEKSAKKLANFFQVTKYQLADFVRITGHTDIHALSLADLATVSAEIAAYTAIAHVGDPR